MKATTKGIAKVGLSLLVLTFLAVFAYSYVFPALAANISDVTISPVYTKCDSNNVYTVNVTNNGPDPVTIVELYNGTYGGVMPNIPPHTNYTCGLAPTGWVLTDLHPSGIPYCQYNAQNSSYYINAGASKTFTFSAIRTAESNYSWGVVTRDSVLAWASHYPASIADCSPPTTVKSFSGPQYPQDNDFWGSPH
jgi:hypothetical protein